MWEIPYVQDIEDTVHQGKDQEKVVTVFVQEAWRATSRILYVRGGSVRAMRYILGSYCTYPASVDMHSYDVQQSRKSEYSTRKIPSQPTRIVRKAEIENESGQLEIDTAKF